MTKYTLLKHKQTGFLAVRINGTGEIIRQMDNPTLYSEIRNKARLNARIKAKNDCMKDLGLVSYRNQSGVLCWE